MSAPRMCASLRSKLFVNSHSSCSFQVSRNAFFWKSDQEEKVEELEPAVKTISHPKSSKMQTHSRLVKGYKPPENLKVKVKEIVQEICGEVPEDLASLRLNDRKIKFKILTKLMTELDHSVSNRELSSMNSLKDVLNYFETEVRDTSVYEDLAKLNLPKNIHIALNSVKFDAEKDTFFKGVSAFPNNETIITSLRRKHRSNRND
ncbi:hypothetical protein SNE40_003186 [Patella caerulea]|uniref:Large ribosomal subunit protein mL50 n=1 Tax=Patella caerulea TaxID=87958 RepID=A0AAN8K7C4_PATCE